MQRLRRPFLIVETTGGLGNQLFQWAAAEAVRQRDGRNLYFAWYQPRASTKRGFSLGHYIGVDADAQLLGFRNLARLGLRSWTGRKRPRPRLLAAQGIEVFQQANFTYEPIPLDGEAIVMDGFFQSWKYFNDAAASIRCQLRLREPVSEEKADLLAAVKSRHSIALHVRRGDYVSDAQTQAVHGSLGIDYYGRALERLAPPKDATVFVFSDDPQWAESYVHVPFDRVVVRPNRPDEPWEDLCVMAGCQDFVTANSSFSWWGAWLSTRRDKQVVAPRNWFVGGDRDTRDLCPPEWHRI